jgi:hypothetical protein
MNIISNFKSRFLLYRYQVPEKVLNSDFSHLSDEFYGFIKYRNRFYHVSDFMKCNASELVKKGWNGFLNDSFFSGILISLSEDGESYKIATFIS